MHQEQLQIFEALGDRRERAVTLGDIARIMTGKGEVEAALALHQEQVQIFEHWTSAASGSALRDIGKSGWTKAKYPRLKTRSWRQLACSRPLAIDARSR